MIQNERNMPRGELMTIAASPITANQLLLMPDDGFRRELIQGEKRKKPPAGDEHSDIAMRLGWRLAQYVESSDLGKVYAAETGFLLSENPDTVRAPDVAFVIKERVQESGKNLGFRRGAPELVAEVVSPNDTFADVEEMAMMRMKAGCRIALVIHPRHRTVTVYRYFRDIRLLTEEETLEAEEAIPGWRVRVGDLFGEG